MELLQQVYLDKSPLSNLIANSCNDCGKDGSEDLLTERITLSAVDQGYNPAATLCLKYIIKH